MACSLSLYKIVLLNLLVVALLLIQPGAVTSGLIIFLPFTNIVCLILTSKWFSNKPLRGFERGMIVLTVMAIIWLCAYNVCTPPKMEVKNEFILWLFAFAVLRTHFYPMDPLINKLIKRDRRIAVLGYNENTINLVNSLRKSRHISFEGYFDNYEPGLKVRTTPKLGTIDYCISIAKEKKISEFYVSVTPENETLIHSIAEEAEKNCIRVHYVSHEKSVQPGVYRLYKVNGTPVFKKYREPLLRLRNQLMKRAFDVFVSSFVILFILSWMVPLVSLLVWLESRGPIFFRQLRSGRDNESFTCLKFRSMVPNGVSDAIQATKNDNRVTRMGAFLRKTSLDEFPQFINVFFGEMSVVGPRPHMLRHTEEYKQIVNQYMARLYLKPGVTGRAQVKGYRGEITDVELLRKRVEHDIWYMENWSLALDFQLVFLTFLGLFKKDEQAY